ncbi:LysR family transcriptional regulator, regulator for bpeEF and oprC [Pararobbsia alpina]|uniref:LysR family transcriptional regulator n=1 Tax=Pararobbsia alpina TaxID=621374 RepID=UPI0039A71B11
MDRFEAMQIFVRVVEARSFSKASDMMNLSPAKVSRTVHLLEERVGVRLLNRSTRSVGVTEDGALFYGRCVRILAEVADAEGLLTKDRRTPSGTVRVDTSAMLARALLLPRLGEFYARYPDIDVRLGLGDRNIDLFQDGVDCVVRMGVIGDASLIARQIGRASIVTCAAPSYIARNGTPRSLDELRAHHAINYVSARTRKSYPFEYRVNDDIVRVDMRSTLAVNDGSTYISAGVLGYGLIQPSRFMVAEHIARGELQEILTNCESPSTPVSLVFPHRRNLSPRLRAFSEWVSDVAQDHPDLQGV